MLPHLMDQTSLCAYPRPRLSVHLPHYLAVRKFCLSTVAPLSKFPVDDKWKLARVEVRSPDSRISVFLHFLSVMQHYTNL